jgi:hypothetical protein
MIMKTSTMHTKSAALAGLMCLLPFVLLNMIVAKRVEPFFSIIRPGIHTSTQEYFLLAFALLLIPLGAFISLRPVRKTADGMRRFYLLNSVTAALLLVVFTAIAMALGPEIYRCDILQIPNCD